MQELIAATAVVGVPLAVLAAIAALAVRARRRGTGTGVLSVFEEMWQPAARRMGVEVVAQEERAAPAPLPGDPPDLDLRRNLPGLG